MRAVGDDTDTLAAMAGALCGLVAVPFVDKLEDGERGQSRIRELAEKLASRAA